MSDPVQIVSAFERKRRAPGHASIVFRRSGEKTVVAAALVESPLRLLTPRNHGKAAWAYLASLGGGLVNGDRLEVSVHAASDATAFISTQASTKVYRSPDGCSQHVDVRISDGAAIAIMPDPVVCFAGARYEQRLDAAMEPRGSLLLLDGYTCGRAARGERWQFDRYESRTTVMRDGRLLLVDATRLDAFPGPIADRMGRFDVILSLLALGPRFAPIRDRMLSHDWAPGLDDDTIAAASPLGANGAILRVAACRFENASRIFRSSFGLLAQLLGDDPFARKW